MTESADHPSLLQLTAEIVAAYVGSSTIAAGDVPGLISSVFASLSSAGQTEVKEPEAPTPAVPIKKSIGTDYLVCLEDGRHVTMLKRYLAKRYDLTPEDYRRRWGLPADYPMVPPAYSERRSALAKSFGLGRKAATPAPEPVKAPLKVDPAPAARSRPVRVGGRRKAS